MNIPAKISGRYAAGAVGALANSAAVWLLGAAGVPDMVGVSMAPDFSWGWLYPRLVWGGLWGMLFLIPFSKSIGLGTLLGLAPAAAALLWFLPQAGKGYLGLELGTLTPLFVIFYNLLWGLVTASWLKLTRD